MKQQQELQKALEEFRRHIANIDDTNNDQEETQEEDIGEYKAAEYIIYSLALSVYIRHLGETIEFQIKAKTDRMSELLESPEFRAGSNPDAVAAYEKLKQEVDWLKSYGDNPLDKVARAGIALLKRLDQNLESFQQFVSGHLEKEAQKKLLERAVRRSARNAVGVGRRATDFRILLNRSTSVIKGVFDSPQARKLIKLAVAAEMMSDGDAALGIFASMPASVVRNPIIRKWIKQASETARPLVEAQLGEGLEAEAVLRPSMSPIGEAASQAADQAPALLVRQTQSEGATGAEAVQEAHANQQAVLEEIQQNATVAAQEIMGRKGESDVPPVRSEVVGIATAAVTAALTDPSNPRNVPETLKLLDDEQRAAAMTDGRVLVAAGAGAGKCVRGDTLVRTDKGLVPIEELASHLEANESSDSKEVVFGLQGPETTSTILNNGVRSTIRLTTHLGYELEGTPNHPIWVLRDGELQWVTLGEVEASDYICIDRRPGMFAEIPFRVAERPFVKITNAEPSQLPTELTPQVAALLGYIISEGQVVYGHHSVVSLTTTDEAQLDLYKAAVEGVISKWNVSCDESRKCWCLKFYHRSDLEALADFGLTYSLAPEKEIPTGILRSPRKVVVSFLRALFDGDGGFCRKEIYYDSSSKKLARQVHTLLLSFGIVSRLRFKPNDKYGCWNVTLTGDNARLFLQEIGFNLMSKQNAAQEALDGLNPNPNLDVIPGLAGLFESVMVSVKEDGRRIFHHPKYHTFKCYRMGTRSPSKKLLGEFLEAYPTVSEASRILQQFHDAPWFYDVVGEVTPSLSNVYDFVVPETHSFSAGGFVNHNSTTLVARVNHLLKDRRVSPNRILVTSFNKKAANELGGKIERVTGLNPDNAGMTVGTMHALFRQFIIDYGDSEEQTAMRREKPSGFVGAGNNVARAVQRIWEECFDSKDRPVPKLKTMLLHKSQWAGNDISPAKAKELAKSRDEHDAADWYMMYEGLKGGIPGWKPPCEERAQANAEETYQDRLRQWRDRGSNPKYRPQKPGTTYEAFMSKERQGGMRLGDFDDMIAWFRDILKRNPGARKKVQSMFDHILIDECVHEDTEVTIRGGGTKRVKDVCPGDEVLSFENGSVVFKKVLDKKQSRKSKGVIVRTTTGRELVMTSSHRLYASSFGEIPKGSLALYLMYRRDKGFRVGTSTNPVQRRGQNGPRPNVERADALWVLEIGEPSEILFKEQALSLRYQVPTYLFEGKARGCDQERIDRIFGEFGEKGRTLLELYDLDFHYPHWVNTTYTGTRHDRRVLTVRAHRGGTSGGTTVSMSWTGEDPQLESDCVYEVKGGRKALMKRFSSYVEARKFAMQVANQRGIRVVENIVVGDHPYTLTTAGALMPGMQLPMWLGGWAEDKDALLRGSRVRVAADKYHVTIPVRGAVSSDTYGEIRRRQIEAKDPEVLPELDSTRLGSDRVVEVASIQDGVFYDLAVEDSANFFANGLLSHNCQDLNFVQHEAFKYMTEHVSDGSDGRSLWMVGDDKQCPSADTLILTPSGELPARELRTGDDVMAWRNGRLCSQKAVVSPSSWTWGYQITTDSGKHLTVSPNHKLWASTPVLEPHQVAVYLMFRRDMGFRVGITNKGKRGSDYLGSLAGRAFQEKAEKMWVLSIHDDREKAKLEETAVSLVYGVPTLVFNGKHRGLNQDRIIQVFERFGRNGMRVLEDRNLSLDYPHWVSKGYAKHSRDCRVVQLLAHGPKFSLVRLEWSPDETGSNPLMGELSDLRFEQTSRGHFRLRRGFANFREAQEFAVDLARRTNSILSHMLATPEGALQKITAAGIFPGMQIPVNVEGSLELEEVTEVTKVEASFVNLEVNDASNFIGGGILSSNSIYLFRGARPDLFTGLHEREGWTTRMIKTNYRCEPEIVEHANKLIAHNEGQIPMAANANPTKPRGVASIRLENPVDEAQAALEVVERIKSGGQEFDAGARTKFYGTNSVLCRTNAELHSYETACIIRGVPYARKGSGSFLGSPETEATLGYVEMVMGTDAPRMQKALGKILSKPNRFWLGPKDCEAIVETAIRDYARRTGDTIKSINPMQALRDRTFRELLAEAIYAKRRKGSVYGYTKDLEVMSSDLDEIQAETSDPGFTTEHLFNSILSLKGKSQKINPKTGRAELVDQTFREALTQELRDKISDEDDIDEDVSEEALLGNIAFLFQLAKPDPTDPEDEANPPTTPAGFQAKIERYQQLAKDLRIDLNKWEKEHPGQTPPAVYLGTVHSVKGAEWPNTFVQMPKGRFPMEKPKRDGEEEEVLSEEEAARKEIRQQEELEAERRLAYVALTRAAKNLTVVCPSVVGGRKAGLSPFVAEAGLTIMGENVPKPGASAAEPPMGEGTTVLASDPWEPSEDPYEGEELVEWNPFGG